MTDPSRKSLYFLKSLLIKVGKLLLERSENRTPQERKELQAKIRRAWERMDAEKWYRSCDKFNLTVRLYGPFFDAGTVRVAYDIANNIVLREMKAKAQENAAASQPVPPSKPGIGQTVQPQQQQQQQRYQIGCSSDSHQTAQPHQITGVTLDSHHTTVVAPSVMIGKPSNTIDTEPDAATLLIRPNRGEGMVWKVSEDKVVGSAVNITQEESRLHTPVITTQHSEGTWWSQNIVDHRIAWATLSDATIRMGMRLETCDRCTPSGQHVQIGARWDLGRGGANSKLCELVSRGAQVYMRRMLDSATAAAWHREQGLARYLLKNLDHSVGGEKCSGAAKRLKRRVAIVPRISYGENSTAEHLAREMKEHRKKIFVRDAKWRAELLNDVQVKEEKFAKTRKRNREATGENWWTQLNSFPKNLHVISTVCAGLLEMQRDLAILHDVGPQARSAKKRMATDESGKAIDIAYLETEDSVVEQDEKTTTQTEQQPISSLGGLLSNNEDENVQRILQSGRLLLGVDHSANNKIKIMPADIREFLAELQPFKDRLQFNPKVLAEATLM